MPFMLTRPRHGVVHGPANEHATDPTRWRGHNLLGFALMQARTQLRDEEV